MVSVSALKFEIFILVALSFRGVKREYLKVDFSDKLKLWILTVNIGPVHSQSLNAMKLDKLRSNVEV
jgi:hypothetical protein